MNMVDFILMSKCNCCGLEMLDEDTIDCPENRVIDFSDDVSLPAVPYVNKHVTDTENHRCHDCGVKIGCYHHPGCDMEKCPQCKEQLISCDCLMGQDED